MSLAVMDELLCVEDGMGELGPCGTFSGKWAALGV
jgi:hypothetical protein